MSDVVEVADIVIPGEEFDAGIVRTGDRRVAWEARRVQLTLRCPMPGCRHRSVKLQAGMPFNNGKGYRGDGYKCPTAGAGAPCPGLHIYRVVEV